MNTRNYRGFSALLMAAFLSLGCLSGCAKQETATIGEPTTIAQPAENEYCDFMRLELVDIAAEAVALAESAPATAMLQPVASGTQVKSAAKAQIDYSNTKDGYVMCKYTAATSSKVKVQVKGPATTYTYNLAADNAWDTYPLTDGNGSYTVTVFENVSGTKYAAVVSTGMSVDLTDQFAPYLRPNQYVDYQPAVNSVAKAAELTSGLTDPLEKVTKVYNYVVTNLTYDKQKAQTVQSGYLPVLDTVLATKTGICFDYAALMTGMLRSQGVPCKLVVGYAGTAYHAWISVYSEKVGWVEGVVYFDGTTWQRMDPTFASSGKQSASIMQYIGDGSHYTVKYMY